MVILFSERKSTTEKEITEILKNHGANILSDKIICNNSGNFTIISIYKSTEIYSKSGIAVFTAQNKKFKNQNLPIGIIGICEENDINALKTFKTNNNAVITCGNNNKNTITFSSINHNTLLITLQRSIIDTLGNTIYPCEFKITLENQYSPFAAMAAATVLLLKGIIPKKF